MKSWVVLALSLCAAPTLHAQIAPGDRWLTISTPNFRVHFTAPLEPVARRAAGEAERAWTRLAAELATPRGPIDLVVADTRDLSNGQANYFPTNRIVIWARPPIDDAALRFSDDWVQQVVTHELAHVFHLDRARGLWRLGQAIFGRHPALFPNGRSPRWLSEGIAIAYESRASGGGRLNGSELPVAMRAWNSEHGAPQPGRLSIASPYWPAGNLAYFGGAQLVAEAERRGGAGSMRKFIDRVAIFPLPYLWDVQARHAFGSSFGAMAAAVVDTSAQAPRPPVQVVAGPYWELRSPRWSGDSLLFTASGPRDLTGLYRARGGDVSRVARRNNADAFGIAGTHFVHAELEFTDPYTIHSSVHVDGTRIARAGRISAPDVRADGMIVGVETERGAARLVLLDSAGRRIRELAAEDPDAQWSAPRWSRAGDAIAAVLWRRGGDSEIVLLSEQGALLARYGHARAVQGSPSWEADDAALYFVSDRAGRGAVYRVAIAGRDSGVVRRVVHADDALVEIDVSPDGTQLAAVRVTPDGYDLVVLPTRIDTTAAGVARASVFAPGLADEIVTAGGAVRRYSPFRSLYPRYWVPTGGTSNRDEYTAGFYTSGTDVIGRHSFVAEGLWDVKTREFYGSGAWSYRGLGVPVLNAAVAQGWTVFPLADTAGNRLGEVTRRNRVAALTATWTRPRIRQSLAAALGAEYEWRHFETRPSALIEQLDPPPPGLLRYPTVLAAATWSGLRRASLALGPEDGVTLSVAARRRWRTDDPEGTTAHSVLGRARAYVSMPLPGHARHVLALYGAAGWAEPMISSVFSVGGVSGTTLELLPGYHIGDAQRAFPVRGFRPGALEGIRAWGASAEYRAPLARVGRGPWPLPFYFQRTSLAVFGDAASAWCPSLADATPACPLGRTASTTLASAGVEIQADLTVEYDTPNRLRLGVATPVAGRDAVAAPRSRFYFSLGFPF